MAAEGTDTKVGVWREAEYGDRSGVLGGSYKKKRM